MPFYFRVMFTVWLHHSLFLWSLVGHLGCFQILATAKLLWTFTNKAFCGYLFSICIWRPKSRIAGLYGKHIYNCIRNCQTLPTSRPVLYCHQPRIGVPAARPPFLLLIFEHFNINHFSGCALLWWMVLRNFLMYLLSTCLSFVKCPCKSFVHFEKLNFLPL